MEWESEVLAALNRIGDELSGIRQALESFIPEQEPTQDAPVGCPHPETDRMDLGMTDGREEWECRQCRQRFRSEPLLALESPPLDPVL